MYSVHVCICVHVCVLVCVCVRVHEHAHAQKRQLRGHRQWLSRGNRDFYSDKRKPVPRLATDSPWSTVLSHSVSAGTPTGALIVRYGSSQGK